ncbi:MAG: hypothetical protein HUJ31_16605 [Pseudomonadales bacterium]|nr:hypothetical protein [Pseudomonadales bacterium]
MNELGGTTAELALGAHFRMRSGWKLGVAFMEDLVSDATPDFALYLSIGP